MKTIKPNPAAESADRINNPPKPIGGGLITSEATEQLIRSFALGAMFMRPSYLSESTWLDHIPFAFWLIEAHRPKAFVELGTRSGASYFSFCQAVDRLRLNTRCFAVDDWEGEGASNRQVNKTYDRLSAYNDSNYSRFSRLVRSSPDEALDHFSDGTIDLLHISGLHQHQAVRGGFESWRRKLSTSGILLLHGTNMRERHSREYKLVEELRNSYPHFEFTDGRGLTVLRVGSDQNEMVERLFKVSELDGAPRAVRDIFGRLGRACADAQIAATHRTDAVESAQRVEKHKQEIANLSQSLDALECRLSERSRELNGARTQLATQAAQHASERGQLSERVALLKELRAEHRAEIQRLRRRLDDVAAELRQRAEEAAEAYRNGAEQDSVRLEEVRAKRDALETELRCDREALAAAQKTVDDERAGRRRVEEKVRSLEEELQQQRDVVESEAEILSSRLQARVAEVEELTKLLGDAEAAAERKIEQAGKVFSKLAGETVLAVAGYAADNPPEGSALRTLAARLRESALLDCEWYVEQYGDVAASGMDPAEHYLRYGISEGRQPREFLKQVMVME